MALRMAPLILAFLVVAMLQFPTGKAQFGIYEPEGVRLIRQNSKPYYYQRVNIGRGNGFIICTKNVTEAQSAPTFDKEIRLCGSPYTATRSANRTAIFILSLYYPYIGLRPEDATADYCKRPTGSPPSLCNPNLSIADPKIAAMIENGLAAMNKLLAIN